MGSWWNKPSSLNWANKKKLSDNIKQLDNNISGAKEDLLALLSIVSYWEGHCKELSEKSNKQQLSAKHIVDIKPLLERSHIFRLAVKKICDEVIEITHDESPNQSLSKNS